MGCPPTDVFAHRHIGPRADDVARMLAELGHTSLSSFKEAVVPAAIRATDTAKADDGVTEFAILETLRKFTTQNQVWRSFIGMGYHDSILPPVIRRNILENPGWYTQYTPYQAEIAQGRLEALLNFQTMVADLTGLPIANASLLDEATAAAEAMALCISVAGHRAGQAFFVSERCHPQTIAVIRTRAEPLGIETIVGDHAKFDFHTSIAGALVQYPATDGAVEDYGPFFARVHAAKALAVAAADPLSCALLRPPGEFGADVAIGSTQRFGVPLGYGGPHAAYMATKQAYVRHMPGRLVGISVDAQGRPALRLALQTREQHIRRAKATSNICTAQVLLAVMAGMYAVYHGPGGLRRIAARIHTLASALAEGLTRLGYNCGQARFFDTVRVEAEPQRIAAVLAAAAAKQINLRRLTERTLTIALDETTTDADLKDLFAIFTGDRTVAWTPEQLLAKPDPAIPAPHARTSAYLAHQVFNQYHSETELTRYIHRLQARDLSLTTSMIPLGSCTMKLNSTTEMLPVTWRGFSKLHPFVPTEQAQGYRTLFAELERMLTELTGFDAVSLQPNAGSQGEYTGLLVIRAYHRQRGEGQRSICLIPTSAHGTNPASAVMAGLEVVPVECNGEGNVSMADLQAKATTHRDRLAALMITYPSTHGVFEEGIGAICETVHANGGQVYLDGANMNAMVGLCRPAEFGADLCHLNLHKTFCIPHGGGGPGMGPIAVKRHLAPFLPTHPVIPMGGAHAIGTVAAAPWGSPSILPIAFSYIAMMGTAGLQHATTIAILNANYIAKRLDPYFPVLFRGRNGLVAHECIVDLRPLKASAGIEVDDVAKRLMDYGFHAPTMQWPIVGTMMIEPTESESTHELDRFCDAMIMIHAEAQAIAQGKADRVDNPLKNAPHTAAMIVADKWTHPYSREQATFPAPWLREHKFWPPVARINNPNSDRNLICSCQSLSTE